MEREAFGKLPEAFEDHKRRSDGAPQKIVLRVRPSPTPGDPAEIGNFRRDSA
jgi:hypothetical protein